MTNNIRLQLLALPWLSSALLSLALCAATRAAEPNESFAAATTLAPGIRFVTDQLTVTHSFPDTLLGTRSAGGAIETVNDDQSLFGDGFASGVQNVATNSGEVRFAVSGTGDSNFTGAHSETGAYEVFVDVLDNLGAPIDAFSEVRTLQPGAVHEFLFSDVAWLDGFYNVNIDNINGANDVDFFKFQGLTPGATFTARTVHTVASTLDTLLGWFDNTGTLLQLNDDGGGGVLSLIEGTVPASGMVTLAVSGFGDNGTEMHPPFTGAHSRVGGYELRVTQSAITTAGDYNGNGIVDAADFTVWRNSLGQLGTGLAADGNLNEAVDIGDYNVWKQNFGDLAGNGGIAGVAVVPEPATAALFALGVLPMLALRRSRQPLERRDPSARPSPR